MRNPKMNRCPVCGSRDIEVADNGTIMCLENYCEYGERITPELPANEWQSPVEDCE